MRYGNRHSPFTVLPHGPFALDGSGPHLLFANLSGVERRGKANSMACVQSAAEDSVI
jgi:hypothetical protein